LFICTVFVFIEIWPKLVAQFRKGKNMDFQIREEKDLNSVLGNMMFEDGTLPQAGMYMRINGEEREISRVVFVLQNHTDEGDLIDHHYIVVKEPKGKAKGTVSYG
jgi:hypothetical protein